MSSWGPCVEVQSLTCTLRGEKVSLIMILRSRACRRWTELGKVIRTEFPPLNASGKKGERN